MSDINIEVAGGTSKRLLTAGKYCDKNILIRATGVGSNRGAYAWMQTDSKIVPNSLLLLHGDSFVDASGNGTDVEHYNVSISEDSRFGGSSFEFNGTTSELNMSSLQVDGDLTLDFWIKLESYNNSNYPTPYNFTDGSGRGFYAHIFEDRTAWQNGMGSSATGNPISLNEWHHIAIVRYGATWYNFLDGVKVAESGAPQTSNTGLYFGRLIEVPDGTQFKGKIDEIRVLNEAVWKNDFTPPTEPYTAGYTILGYVVSDDADAYPNGEQAEDGYWYYAMNSVGRHLLIRKVGKL